LSFAAAAFASFSIETKYGLVKVLRISETPTGFPVEPAAGLDAAAELDAAAGVEAAAEVAAPAEVAAAVGVEVEVDFDFDELQAASVSAHTARPAAAARR
jgi:hypothetical protein